MILNTSVPTFVSETTALADITSFNGSGNFSIYCRDNVPNSGFYVVNGNSIYAYLLAVDFSDSVKTLGTSAFQAQKLASFPNNFKNIETIGHRCFYGCASMQTFNAPNVTEIDSAAFAGCSSLTTVNIPSIETVTGNSTNYLAPFYCATLASITFGNNLKTLGTGNTYVFYNCSDLTSIHLPASLTSVSGRCFYNTTNLTNVTVGQGFNCNLPLGYSGDLSKSVLEAIVANYADNSGKTLTVTSYTYTDIATQNFGDTEKTIERYASDKGLTIASI